MGYCVNTLMVLLIIYNYNMHKYIILLLWCIFLCSTFQVYILDIFRIRENLCDKTHTFNLPIR